MVEYKDECVGCPPEMGCIGSICPYQNVPHYFCDICGKEVKDFIECEDGDICIECFEERNKEEQ